METLVLSQPAAAARRGEPRHFAFVDSLRGLAILMVILVHCSQKVPHLPGRVQELASQGKFGVQLFFVVSAFTLFWSMRSRSSERKPLHAFFVRRVFRIGPLFWAALAFYVWWYGLGPRYYAPGGIGPVEVVLTCVFLHGWHPTAFNSVVPGGWSIAAEFSFYLLIPFLYARVRSLNAALWLTLVSTAVVALASGPAAHLISRFCPQSWRPIVPDFIYCSFPSQFPVFCLGFVLYFLLLRPSAEPGGGRAGLAAFFVAASALLVFFALPRHVLCAAAFVLLAYGLADRPSPLIVNRFTRFAGVVSYSAYLWHFVLLDLIAPRFLRLVGGHAGSKIGSSFALVALYFVTVAVALAASWITHALIEVPGQQLGRAIIRRMGWGRQGAMPP